MRAACKALVDSCNDGARAYDEFEAGLRSLKGIVGSSSQRRSCRNLKRLGVAIMLAPSPEPFTDLVGLAMIGAGEVEELLSPPLTLSDMPEAVNSIFESLENYRPFSIRLSMWDTLL